KVSVAMPTCCESSRVDVFMAPAPGGLLCCRAVRGRAGRQLKCSATGHALTIPPGEKRNCPCLDRSVVCAAGLAVVSPPWCIAGEPLLAAGHRDPAGLPARLRSSWQ